jgi:hypothetical protein
LLFLGAAVLHGALTTVALCAPAALISALVRKRLLGAGVYFGLYSGSAVVAEILAHALGERWPHLLSLPDDIHIVGQALYGQPPDASPLLAALLLFVLCGSTIALAYRKLRHVDVLG